jgi:hypothetical protein
VDASDEDPNNQILLEGLKTFEDHVSVQRALAGLRKRFRTDDLKVFVLKPNHTQQKEIA